MNCYIFSTDIGRRILLSALLMMTMVGFLTAQWSTNPAVNNAICTATNSQYYPTIVSDGSGGAIITWYDYRSGNADIYAQHINASGTVQWTADGVTICTATSEQLSPAIVSDGSGGAIITWEDDRSGNAYIYAQRINASGAVQWTANGVAICTAPGGQSSPTIVSDGSGGAIITWVDFRSGSYPDIYAQRINASGAVQWTANGVAVCTATSDQAYPTIVSDGSGGAIITWVDFRSGSNYHIYAQRVRSDSTKLWTPNGIAICTATGNQYYPTMVSDGSGGAIITWYDDRSGNGDIYAQRVRSDSTKLWTPNGIAICTATDLQEYPTIVSDGSGGAIITWMDYRSGSNYDIYAQRVRSDSTKLWAPNGIAICTATGNQYYPTMVSDGSGGAIITWYDYRSGAHDIYAQHINASGTVQWTTDGVAICTATHLQDHPMIVNDGSGGAIITWEDGRNGAYDIYAQRVDRFGNLYPEPWIDKVGDIANDQGGTLRVLWYASKLDIWPDSTVRTYTVEMGVKSTGLLGKASATNKIADDIFWQTVATVPAKHYTGYNASVTTSADSGIQGIPWYYFRVTAQSSDGLIFWTSNVDSGYSVDNIPPVGVKGSAVSSTGYGSITLVWNKDRVDPDLMGYQIYRSTSTGFLLDKTNQLALSFDTTYTDATPTPGQTYYYRIAGVDIHGNLGTPSDELSQTALSVNLSSFAAMSSRLSAELRWMTTTETNIYGFEIERRSVGQGGTPLPAWQEVGFVAGSGTSSSPRQYGYVDRTVTAGTYDYRIKQIQTGGSYAYSSTVELFVGLAPKEFTLSQNYPNPFNPTTNIEFTIPQDGRVRVTVYNTLGEEVATLLDQNMEAGVYHRVSFDATHEVSGVYLVRLQFGDKQLVKKMILLK